MFIKKTLFVLLATFCSLSANGETDQRDLMPFTKVSVSGSFDVTLKQADQASIKIKTYRVPVDNILTNVKSNELILEIKDEKKKQSSNVLDRVIVTIYTSKISEISKMGSSNILSTETWVSPIVTIDSQDSGEINMQLKCDEVDVQLKGSGKIRLKGKAKRQNISLMGSGNYNASKLESTQATIKLMGSGSAYLNVDEYIDANLTGSGSVYFSGDAKVQSTIHGSGRIEAN